MFAKNALGLAAALGASLLGAAAASAETATTPATLRICASENEAPFSFKDGKGFENRIAAVLAKAMGREPVFVWSDKPAIYLVRDQLDKKSCDVVMGVDTGDQRVLTTRPYYRSGYVFITRADVTVKDWNDPAIAKMSSFAVGFGSPAESMLRSNGKWENNAAYLFSLVNFKAPRNQYVRVDPAKIVQEVADGHADLGVAFSPEVARYLKDSGSKLKVTLIPDDNARSDGLKIPHHFDQSIGVRKDDRELLAAIDAALVKAKPEIDAVLADEGIITLPPGS